MMKSEDQPIDVNNEQPQIRAISVEALSAELIARIDAVAPVLHQLVEEISDLVNLQHNTAATPEEVARLELANPIQWIVTSQLQLQQGLMALRRAVAQPTVF